MMDADCLTNDQTEKVLQFQDLTGIEDMNVCRDILIRHQWDLEVAFQEQLNIREGRPTMRAGATNVRAPAVVNDRFLQQVFTATLPGGRTVRNTIGSTPIPRGITGIISYFINIVFQYCYSTLSSVISAFLNFGRNDERIVTDPLGDVMSFIHDYNQKYPVHPVFYQGTYAQALNDAKQELRFLLVYLHQNPQKNPDVDSFCRETLADSSVINFINRNTLFWGCDVASPEGYRVSHSITARTYPTLVLITLHGNRMTVVGRFEGDCTPAEFIRRLQTVISANEVWLSQARADRLERNLTQTLRRQQDEAYEQSLLADEEKERQKEAIREQQRLEELAKERAIQEERRRKEEICQKKIDLAQSVPQEPSADEPDIICVVFKLPNGARIERRFHKRNSLQDVRNYLFCHPLSPDEFEITTNFPRRVLLSYGSEFTNDGNDYKTLEDVGLKNREVLFVNDLEA